MTVGSNLTNLQRVALRGEVAYTVSTATHNAEIKYRIYTILKEVEDEYKPFLIEAFKEAVTFDEGIVDRLYLETLTNEVPVWLWIEKVIADIKESLFLTETTGVCRVSINKVEERKKILESSFLNFARQALMTDVDASEQLFEEVMNDNDLSFLHTSCFYLKSCCSEVRDSGTVQDRIPEELMDCHFDIRDMLSLKLETEALEMFNRGKPKSRVVKDKKVKTEKIFVPSDISDEELRELINKKILAAFADIPDEEPRKNFKYIVTKVFNNTNISTTIRVCDTREEAEQFVEKIKREYPELQETCEFYISKEKRDGN